MHSRVWNNAKLGVLNVVSRTKRRMIGPHVEALLVSSKNGLFLVDVEDQTVGRKLSYNGEYGLDELARLQSAISPQSHVLVVGTHIGTLAVAISKHCAQLTAIEANPKTFRFLELNLLINACANVRAINIAASDKREAIQFVMNRTNSGGSKRLPVHRDYAYFYDSPEVISVNAVPLDELLAGQSFEAILMDIEGSEYFALKGMQTLLASARVLFMEFVPHHLKNVSGVSVPELLSTVTPHFSHLFIPSKNLRLSQEQFVPALQGMFDNDESDDGLEFSK